MYGFVLALWMHDAVATELGQEEARVIRLFETEPDWFRIARIAREPLDVEAWETESRRRVEEWTARVQKESPKPSRRSDRG
jgi:hypothetical protein